MFCDVIPLKIFICYEAEDRLSRQSTWFIKSIWLVDIGAVALAVAVAVAGHAGLAD